MCAGTSDLSPLYDGTIKGVSARYCPSLEDKVIKFSSRDRHQIILEPEGLDTEEIYVSGTGNSLPYEIQLEILHSITGLENAEIMRPAYAIEYDYVLPTQLKPTLEAKALEGPVHGRPGKRDVRLRGGCRAGPLGGHKRGPEGAEAAAFHPGQV